jgi:hypothetical protein
MAFNRIGGGSFWAHNVDIEHDPEKWEPVFPNQRLRLFQDHAQDI